MSAVVRRLDECEGRWVRLILDAPPGNLLSLQMVRHLSAALDALEDAPSLRWLTVEGAGREFCFGAKIQEHLPEPMRVVLPETHALLMRWLAMPVPTAALVEGRCLGGGFELALCCDDILAAAGATFGLPEVRVGAFAPAGSLLLPVKVGAARASRALVTGDTQDADYWYQAGLMSLVAPGAMLVSSARRWFGSRLAGQSVVALSHAAFAARAVVRAQVEPLLPVLERRYLGTLLQSRDATEGIRAWMEKRPPRWQDR
jgi:cyclohexa-1,5-dienecarbonyl-CoA hydratase